MFDIFNSETFWLDATNVILGLVTAVCLAIVGRVAFKEIRARVASRVRIPLAEDTHAFDLADLGITMADGGVRIDEAAKKVRSLQDESSDPSNIIRSEN
jgi:hypothetical protein